VEEVTEPLAGLTAQERRVAELVGEGASNKAVARRLGLAMRTVEFHLGNTYKKLGIGSRAELANLVGRWSVSATSVSAGPPVAQLFDRELEIGQIAASLSVHRLVTLRGPGGVGKTSLAVAAAAPLRDRFADGCWFVDLSTVTRGHDVVAAATEALGLRPVGVPTDPHGLADALEEQQRLVILDNCEHVLDEARAVADVLGRRCPRTVVLTTSRQRLDLVHEHIVAVGPLSLIAHDGPSPAGQLFIERARAVDPTLVLTSADHESIERICRQLDGLPLAIELAASRTFAFGLTELERRLDHQLDVAARRGGGAERQRSVPATIDWSYRLLTAFQQETLASLSSFAGDFDLDAAIAIAGPGRTAASVTDDIADLVEASVVNVSSLDAERRLRLLETIRTYAAQRLEEQSMIQDVATRHLRLIASRAARANALLRGVAEIDGHRSFQHDWPDIRRAMTTAIASNDGSTATALINDLLMWAVTRNRTEVGPWCEAVIALPSVADLPGKIPAIAGAMRFAYLGGDVERAVALYEQGRAEEARLGPFPEPILPAFAVFVHGHDTTVGDAMRRSIALAHEVQDRAGQIDDLFWLVLGSTAEAGYLGALLRTGNADGDEALSVPQRTAEVMELANRFDNPYLRASGHIYHALAIDRTDPERATRLIDGAMHEAQQLEISLLTGQARIALAAIDRRDGRPLDALAGLRVALVEDVRAAAISDVLADLASCVRPLADVAHAHHVDALIAELQTAHPATAAAYGLATLNNGATTNSPNTSDILRRANCIIELIDDLLTADGHQPNRAS
jgi:predicted ATPase/DNA-binding CsgD family transcriptional regulator